MHELRRASWILGALAVAAFAAGCETRASMGEGGNIAPPGDDLVNGGLAEGADGVVGGAREVGPPCWEGIGDVNNDGVENADDCLWDASCDRQRFMLADADRDGDIDVHDCVPPDPFEPPTGAGGDVGGGEGEGADDLGTPGEEGDQLEGQGPPPVGGEPVVGDGQEGEGEGEAEAPVGADPDAEEGDIRLVPGPIQGRVEVMHDGVWGTICHDYWDLLDGRVTCRQLGFADAEQVFLAAHFGEGRGEIWLDSLQCRGDEERLVDCPSPGFGVHNCGHHEDAGVICAQ